MKVRRTVYEGLNGKYLAEAEEFLAMGDLVQASEKLWGAAAEMIKAVAAKRKMELGTHASLWAFVSNLDKERPEWMLKRGFSYAGNLHQNFYEDWLTREYVEEGLQLVKDFTSKLKSLL